MDKSSRSEEIKTQFRAREGYYRLMNSPDYSQRSQRAMGLSTGTANSNSSTNNHEKSFIKISLVTLGKRDSTSIVTKSNIDGRLSENQLTSPFNAHRRSRGARDMKICFNVGRELFVYNYDGVRTGPDASHPIYKRSYKSSLPTCHDFNKTVALDGSICLLVGFSQGQVQSIDLSCGEDKEICKEFNVDRLVDRTRVTCVKWLPNSSSLFLVSHASGHLYIYDESLPCGPTAPVYQAHKQSEGVEIYSCKSKTPRNPVFKWCIGASCSNSYHSNHSGSSTSINNLNNESFSLNEFAFSPCYKYLACVSQDGFLRVYCYETMEQIGRARSYYGGLSCVCWSPDGKYVVTGGEDDLITVWSFIERRVVARGMGHKSWVSVVSFDSFYTGHDLKDTDVDNYDDEDEDDGIVDEHDLIVDGEEDDDDDDLTNFGEQAVPQLGRSRSCGAKNNDILKLQVQRTNHMSSDSSSLNHNSTSTRKTPTTSYRFGSVGQDTQLCLWDLNDDLLKQPIAKLRISPTGGANSIQNLSGSPNITHQNDLGSAAQVRPSSVLDAKLEDHNSNKDSPPAKAPAMGGSFLSTKGSSFTKTFSLVGKRDKRPFGQKGTDKTSNVNGTDNDGNKLVEDPLKLLGSSICPRMSDIPILEPSICKKISFERLTSLIFCQGGFITSCQDGYVFSWARPSRVSTPQLMSIRIR